MGRFRPAPLSVGPAPALISNPFVCFRLHLRDFGIDNNFYASIIIILPTIITTPNLSIIETGLLD
jgi:hypothetical protein